MDWASYLSSAPQLDIFEGIICDKIYGDGGSTALSAASSAIGRDCTTNAVQSELALITQIMTAANEFPSIFLAIPYGALADRVGRRLVLFLSLLGLLAQDVLVRCITWWPSVFPLWLVWLTPMTTLVGGGSSVAIRDAVPRRRGRGRRARPVGVLLADGRRGPRWGDCGRAGVVGAHAGGTARGFRIC